MLSGILFRRDKRFGINALGKIKAIVVFSAIEGGDVGVGFLEE